METIDCLCLHSWNVENLKLKFILQVSILLVSSQLEMFKLYFNKLFRIIETHLPNPHCYANDTQLYIASRPGNDMEEFAALTAMESSIADFSQWMQTDKLKLNADKTDCLLIGTRQQLQKVSNISIFSVGNSKIAPSFEVRNLGIWFDSKMSMLSRINRTCSSAFYHLYNIRRIRKYLSRSWSVQLGVRVPNPDQSAKH